MANKTVKKNFKIKVTSNGPYLISGGVPLSDQIICTDAEKECHGWREGKKYTVQENYALCRCGGSGKKPFCDGSHVKNGFNGKTTASKELYLNKATRINGPGLDLTDDVSLCALARFCHRSGGTWNLTRQSDNTEAMKTAIEEAGDCPAGRLVAWDKTGKAIEPDFEPSIGLVVDSPNSKMGPIWVRGGIPIEAEDRTTCETRNRVTLCRCGKSANKPFCDGKHTELTD